MFYYFTPTPSEAIEPKIRLVLSSAFKELGATSHSVVEVRVSILLPVGTREFEAASGPVGTVAAAMEAVTTEPLTSASTEVLVVRWVTLSCNLNEFLSATLISGGQLAIGSCRTR